MTPRQLLLVVALAALPALACTETTRSTDAAGTYGLTAVDGSAPPSLVGATVEADLYLVGGELELDPAGRFVMQLVTMLDTRTGGPLVDSLTYVYLGSYLVGGRAISLVWSNSAGQRTTFSGTADGGFVTLTVGGAQPIAATATLQFRRSGPG